MCPLVPGSFSGNPVDPQKAHIQSKPTAVLKKLNNLIDILLKKDEISIKSINSPIMINTHENKMVLPRKAEKLCNGLSRRNGPNIPLQQAFLLVAF